MKKQVRVGWNILTFIPTLTLVGIRGKVSRALITLSFGLALSQASLAGDYYATPSGAGSQNGSSWCNALSASQIENTLDSSMQPGDVLHLGSGTYSQAIHIDSSGAAFTSKRIVGEDTGSGPPVIDMGNWSRMAPTVGAWNALGFGNAASYWIIENLVIQDVVHGIRTDDLTTSQYFGITLRNLTLRNCRHPMYIFDAKNWQIENCKAKEYTKHGFRFDHNCTDMVVRDCTADLSSGDTTWYDFTEAFPVGFLVDDPGAEPPNSNITFEGCVAQHHRLNGQLSTDYWNGDGFVINQNNTGFYKIARCRAMDNEDGGFDIKPAVTMTDCVAFQNKRNFRFHAGTSFMSNCVSGYPLKRGGAFGFGGVWVQDATLTLDFCTIHGSDGIAAEEDNAGQITLNNSMVSFSGSSGTFTSGSVTLASTTVTYRPSSGVDPRYVNPHAGWDGVGSDMNSLTYGTTKGYFQDDHQIVETNSAPTIDGLADASWSAANSQTIANVVVGTVAIDNDLSGNFRTLWDANNLYVLVQVNDEAQRNDSGTQTWNDDSVEIYIDANNDKPTTYGSNDYQYRFTWTGSSLGIEEIKHGATTGVTASRVATATGYIVEVKLPWSTLGQSSVAVGALSGLDVHINDDDDGGNRDGKKAWFNTADTSWQNPSTFATAKLVGICR